MSGRLLIVLALAATADAANVRTFTVVGRNDYQVGDGTWRNPLSNPSPTRRFGQPNSHFPWLNPGGIPGDEIRNDIGIIKEFEIPDGKIKSWRGKGSLPPNLIEANDMWKWKFPVNTVARVRLFANGREFTQHVSTKVSDGVGIEHWHGEEIFVSDAPSWYKPPANCTDCHEDVGKHAGEVHPEFDNYYNRVRGGDGRFTLPHEFIKVLE